MMTSVVRSPWSVVGLLLVLGLSALLGADQPTAGTTDHGLLTTDDRQDFVFLGDPRPVLIRLHVHVDGRPFRTVHRAAWDDYLRRLFRHLDRNGDGALDEKEAEPSPPPELSLPGVGRPAGDAPAHIAFNFRAVDADGNGRVTPAELADYYQQFGGEAFQTRFAGPLGVPSVVQGRLFARLDTNGDGKLSKDELAAAEASLFKLDANNDEILTPAELLASVAVAESPEAMPAAPTAGALPDRSPFEALMPGERPVQLAQRCLRRYGAGRPTPSKKLSRTDIGYEPDVFDQLDVDKDSKLDAEELLKIAELPPDIELVVHLGKRKAGEPLFEATSPEGPHSSFVSARTASDRSLVLSLGRVRVELRVHPDQPAEPTGHRQALFHHFRAADADRSGWLDKAEARQGNFYPAVFALLDRDGDGRLTEKEIKSYFDDVQSFQGAALAGRPSLLISDEGKGLFELLDQNRDGRLSLREIRAAPQLVGLIGEADAGLKRDSLPTCYQLGIGLCQATLNRHGNTATFSPVGMPLLSLEWGGAGPTWFRKMDRNRDGEVSPNEFLGRRDDFRRLDADKDGLISVDEAITAAKTGR